MNDSRISFWQGGKPSRHPHWDVSCYAATRTPRPEDENGVHGRSFVGELQHHLKTAWVFFDGAKAKLLLCIGRRPLSADASTSFSNKLNDVTIGRAYQDRRVFIAEELFPFRFRQMQIRS